jgi:hypothetical protein
MTDKNPGSFSGISTAAYTVVTPNYLAHAWSLKKSFLEHNQGVDFFICILGEERHCPQMDNTTIYFINALSDNRIGEMIQRYNPFELSCALKPFFASHILEHHNHVQRLIYLDSDMYVFGAFAVLSDAAITLSPHRTVNVNYLPGFDNFSTIDLLKYGVYNAGYFELLRKPEALNFIKWWQALMVNHAYNKPEENLFTDQLWLSTVPSFFNDVFINKNPGYNAAFWNLIERKITFNNDRWYVNDEPLILFHYSNYKVEEPERLVNFEHPMLSFASLPELKPIFEKYRIGLLEAGYAKIKTIPYPFSYKQETKKWWKKLFG